MRGGVTEARGYFGLLLQLPLQVFRVLAKPGCGALELTNQSVPLLQTTAVLGCENNTEEELKALQLLLIEIIHALCLMIPLKAGIMSMFKKIYTYYIYIYI